LVSIHTPVKGVTTLAVIDVLESNVSIHTPVKGVTVSFAELVIAFGRFDPHPREGGDA